jgi:hypothetical protein
MEIDVPSLDELSNQLDKQSFESEEAFAEELELLANSTAAIAGIEQLKLLETDYPTYKAWSLKQQQYLDTIISDSWGESLSGLAELLYVLEVYCQQHSKDLSAAFKTSDSRHLIYAVTRLVPKGLLIAQEMLHLLKGGFPDGALSKWRSLHEILITVVYLLTNGEKAAKLYIASLNFSELARLQKSFNDNKGVRLSPENEVAFLELREECDHYRKDLNLGSKSYVEGAWPRILGRKLDSIEKLEKAVGLSGLRSMYDAASSWIHSTIVPTERMLAAQQRLPPDVIIGPTANGFDMPIKLLVRCLHVLTSHFFRFEVTVASKVMIAVTAQLIEALEERLASEGNKQFTVERLGELFPDWERDPHIRLRPVDD